MFQRAKKRLKLFLRRQVLKLIGDRLDEVATQASTAASYSANREVEKLRRQLAALQAIDLCFQESGKIIIVARAGKRDIVKVIDIAPRMPMDQYRSLSQEIEARYGISKRHIDGPLGFEHRHFI